jgi:hypothetical protein
MAVLQLCFSLTVAARAECVLHQKKKLAVVNKELNMWQQMHMGRGSGDWNKMAHVLPPGIVFC